MSEGIPEDGSVIRFSTPMSTLYWFLLLFLNVFPTVESSSCVRPFSVQHGRVNGTETNRGSFPLGTVLQYTCEIGYSVEGPSIIICTKEGLWSSPPPRCLHNNCCLRPFSIQHGEVNSTEINRSSFPVGTVLQYSCDSGYSLEGSSIIVCTKEGLWSSPTPRCLRNNMCSPPFNPENGGYICHPSQCHRLTHGTVVEYFCDEGFTLKGDYKYLTCQNGKWNRLTQISCVLSEGEHHVTPVLGIDTLSIVATTASSVALVLLLVVAFVLLQPKLKSFSNTRRELRGSEPVTIMVEGVQVTLPSYEEAVSGAGGTVMDQPQAHSHLESLDCPSGQTSSTHHTEDTELCQPPSSSSSSWSLDGAHGAIAVSSLLQCQNPDCSQFSLHSSQQDLADDIPLLKES